MTSALAIGSVSSSFSISTATLAIGSASSSLVVVDGTPPKIENFEFFPYPKKYDNSLTLRAERILEDPDSGIEEVTFAYEVIRGTEIWSSNSRILSFAGQTVLTNVSALFSLPGPLEAEDQLKGWAWAENISGVVSSSLGITASVAGLTTLSFGQVLSSIQITGQDIIPPYISNFRIVDAQDRLPLSTSRIFLSIGRVWDEQDGVHRLRWRVEDVFQEETSEIGALEGLRSIAFPGVTLTSFSWTEIEVEAEDAVGNIRTAKRNYFLEEFQYRDELRAEAIAEVAIYELPVAIAEVAVEKLVIAPSFSWNWMVVSGSCITQGERVIFQEDGSAARYYDPRFRAGAEIAWIGTASAVVGNGYVEIQGDRDSWIDNLRVLV